jgi:hypothetical protein
MHVAESESAAAETKVACPNCDAAIVGEFCARCGQERLHAGDLSLAHAWHHVAHELLHWDGRILSTFWLLLRRPGQLTLDYLEGRRKRHINPLRIFLMVGALYFVGEAAPYSRQIITSRPLAATRQALRTKAAAEGVGYDVRLGEAIERAHVVFKSAFIASVMVNGFLLWLAFRRRSPYVVAHLVTALHLTSVWMPVLLVSGVAGRWLHKEAMLAGVAALVIIGYNNVAMHRVYSSGPRVLVGIGATVLFLVSLAVPIGATFATFYWAAR